MIFNIFFNIYFIFNLKSSSFHIKSSLPNLNYFSFYLIAQSHLNPYEILSIFPYKLF